MVVGVIVLVVAVIMLPFAFLLHRAVLREREEEARRQFEKPPPVRSAVGADEPEPVYHPVSLGPYYWVSTDNGWNYVRMDTDEIVCRVTRFLGDWKASYPIIESYTHPESARKAVERYFK